MSKQRRAEVFVPAAEDPRNTEPVNAGEKETLADYLRFHRQTLALKCSGLDAEQLARRSVEPSTMSLLGLVRHMAEVERGWFKNVLAGLEVPRIYRTPEEPDLDWDGAVADPAVVERAWADLREEQAFAERFVEEVDDLSATVTYAEGKVISVREVLVHMIEEYARHNGHADLLRERIDGRVGQ